MKLQKSLVLLASLTLAASMAGLTVVSISQSVTAQEQSSLIAELANNSDALREQVKDSGEVPVAPSADKVVEKSGAAGAPGVNGRDGSSGVNGINGANGADGPPGPPGAPGLDGVGGLNGGAGAPGAAGANGSDGPSGPTGPQGEPGPAGPPGPAGADSTVPGPSGTDGAPGPAGVGIAAIVCDPDGRWHFTLTDTTELYVDGPCRIVAPPIEGVTP